MQATVRRTWAPRGQTPVLVQRGRSYKKISAIGAISLSPKQYRGGLYMSWHPDQSITQYEILMFLRHLLMHLRGPVILIWDRLRAHRANLVRQWCESRKRLSVRFLPPYAPELNAVEYLWGYLKYHRLSNHGLVELEEIQKQATLEVIAVKKKSSLLRSFVHATGVSI